MKLKALHFVDVAEIQAAVTGEFKEVQKEEFSAKARVNVSGDYFE